MGKLRYAVVSASRRFLQKQTENGFPEGIDFCTTAGRTVESEQINLFVTLL